MPKALEILSAMPPAGAFYEKYWNQKPFVVRGAISDSDLENLISADELAGLAMEQAPQSRMVKTPTIQHDWKCCFGPFKKQDFTQAGDTHWTLLVQNVEQFHPPTATLLRHFNFSPRWLMDDIMVSYSEPGGTVGAHIDNYHVFLVQGQGKRQWCIGQQPLLEENYIQGLDFKILQTDSVGDDVILTTGDVLYLPPRFAHQGTTLESALTFSVGFLGPKLSELLSGYGQYLSQFEDIDPRYVGAQLVPKSSQFYIHQNDVNAIRENINTAVMSKTFSRWLVEFMTENSHDDFGVYEQRERPMDVKNLQTRLESGGVLIKPEYVKFALTDAGEQSFCLGFDGHSFILDENSRLVVEALMTETPFCGNQKAAIAQPNSVIDLLCQLYNHQALEFAE